MSDARDGDAQPGSAGWPGRLGAGYKMGFGHSNERGGAEDEVVNDSASDRDGERSRRPTPEKRSTSRPRLKIEEASPAKRPRREVLRTYVEIWES